MKKLFVLLCLFAFVGWSDNRAESVSSSSAFLDEVLDSQTDEMKARYQFRNPKKTLEFFGIERGMTVVEVLPGSKGWYTKLLVPFLGSEGSLVGANYALGVYSLFGFEGERLEKMASWPQSWPADIKETLQSSDGAKIQGFMLGEMPESLNGTADAVLLIRALHNLARFESQGAFLSSALKNTYDVLKPGGIVGIVQHHAREEMSDEWADGSKGYLKRSFVIQLMTDAGFELVGSSDHNQNVKDQPTEEDVVWRLPPSLGTSKDDDELRKSMLSIGESNRMTLKFKKPI